MSKDNRKQEGLVSRRLKEQEEEKKQREAVALKGPLSGSSSKIVGGLGACIAHHLTHGGVLFCYGLSRQLLLAQ